jgi:hypothetical protein
MGHILSHRMYDPHAAASSQTSYSYINRHIADAGSDYSALWASCSLVSHAMLMASPNIQYLGTMSGDGQDPRKVTCLFMIRLCTIQCQFPSYLRGQSKEWPHNSIAWEMILNPPHWDVGTADLHLGAPFITKRAVKSDLSIGPAPSNLLVRCN